MLWGRAVHCLLFEPIEFPNRYRAWSGRRAGNDYKAFVADAWEDGAEILTESGRYSLAAALEAAQGFVSDPLVKRLIAAGKPEVTVFATEGNVQCRGRLDWISTVEDCIVDLKTARNITAKEFGRDFYKFHYDLKLGLYRRWLAKVTRKPWRVEVIVLENSEPYDCVVMPIPDAVLDRGAAKGLEIIAKVDECINAQYWPGVADGDYVALDTPVWEMDDDEETVEFTEDQ